MPDQRRRIQLPFAISLRRTLARLRNTADDPTFRFGADGTVWRATRTPDGPATLHLVPESGDLTTEVGLEAWGAGAGWVLEQAPALIGCFDDDSGFTDHHPAVTRLRRRLPGPRLGRTDNVVEALVPAVLRQRVTAFEAGRAFRQVMRDYGEPAPGPGGLVVPPHPDRLAGVPYYDLHVRGVERARADTIRRACAHAGALQRLGGLPPTEARSRLRELPGIGAWTAAEVAVRAFGDPDAVSVGDANLPGLVSWHLTGDADADDDRMLALLDPWRGQRARVIQLFELSGQRPPRTAPRAPIRSIAQT